MRAMFTGLASASIAVGLLGCGQGEQATTPAPVVAAAPACNCQQQARAVQPAPVAAPVSHHRHRHVRRQHDESYAFASSSDSTSSYGEPRDEDVHTPMAENGDGARDQGQVWVDGYGRSHYATTIRFDDNPAALGIEDHRNRHTVWRGYDSKCDEKHG